MAIEKPAQSRTQDHVVLSTDYLQLRGGTEGPRFRTWIVEGEGCDSPGRIRTIVFDTNVCDTTWIKPVWDVGEKFHERGVLKSLKSVGVKEDKYERGARLLEILFAEDPDEKVRTKGYAAWLKWHEARDGKGHKMQAFPDDLLPAEVKRLRKVANEKPTFVLNLDEIEAPI